jgi:hypothetical protein
MDVCFIITIRDGRYFHIIGSQSGPNRENIPIAFILTISSLRGAFILPSYHYIQNNYGGGTYQS